MNWEMEREEEFETRNRREMGNGAEFETGNKRKWETIRYEKNKRL